MRDSLCLQINKYICEGLDLHSAGPQQHLSKQVLKSRLPCKMPTGIFHHECFTRVFESLVATKKPPFEVVLSWLGMRDSPRRQKKFTFVATTLRAKGAVLVHRINPFESQQHVPNEKPSFRWVLHLATHSGRTSQLKFIS